jgi:hypothetical protein
MIVPQLTAFPQLYPSAAQVLGVHPVVLSPPSPLTSVGPSSVDSPGESSPEPPSVATSLLPEPPHDATVLPPVQAMKMTHNHFPTLRTGIAVVLQVPRRHAGSRRSKLDYG